MSLLTASEGIHGQVRVYDFPFYTEMKGEKRARGLVVNNTLQSILDKDSLDYNLWDWSILFPSVTSIYPKGSSMLLMGLGGGMLYHQFLRQGYQIDVVELDARIRDAAIQHFAVPVSAPIVVDDARHVINTTKKKYDVIVLDLFFNETPPAQVPTLESFRKLKAMLNPKGMVVMNFYGFVNGKNGKAARSVVKTFDQAGFHTTLFHTPEPEEGRNLIICANTEKPDWTQVNYAESARIPMSYQTLQPLMIDKSALDMTDAEVLTDSKPILEKMYSEASMIWRRTQIEMWLKNILQTDIDLMK